jgi:hypothetical protein
VIIGEIIARVRLIDNLNHAGYRINLRARSPAGGGMTEGTGGGTCWFIEASPKLIPHETR